MKKILTILLVFLSLSGIAQRKHVDTVMQGMFIRIDWDTTNTGPTELVWFTPGSGEKGGGTLHDSIYVHKYGPEEWIAAGWNGNAILANGTHKLMFCTFIQDTLINSSMFTQPTSMKPFFDAFIASRFHQFAKDSAWGIVSLSSGAWLAAQYNSYLAGVGDYSYWKYFKWFVDIEGVKPDDTFGSDLPFPQKFGNRAHVAKLAFFGFDQISGLGTSFLIQQNIVDSVPSAKAFNIWTNFGDGGHDNFDSVTNPAATNWTASNPNLRTTNSSIPSVFFAGGQNIYQAGIRTADTSITNSPPTVNAGGTQTIGLPTTSVTLTGTATPTGINTISSHTWSFVSGPATPTIVSASNLTTSVTGLTTVGTYKILLSATDNLGGTGQDTAFVIVVNGPIAHAGGTYIYNEDPHGINITYPINLTASTGSNLKYSWTHFTTGFYPNNSATPSTNTGIESTWDNLKQADQDTAVVTQLWLATDSVRKFGYIGKVTDSVTGLFSIDTCYIVFRARKDYPPQNFDGAGFHVWGTNPTYDNLHFPHGNSHTIVIPGGNDDGIHDATGATQKMSIFIPSSSSLTLDHTAKPIIAIAGGHYRTISILGDTLGGSGMQLSGQDTAHAFTITFYDTCVVTDFGFHLSNPMYGRLTGIYDSANHLGMSAFPGAQNGYAYTQGKYGFQFGGLNQYVGGAGASIDGITTRWFTVDNVEVKDGHADGIAIKQDAIPGHSNFAWTRITAHDLYIHDIHQEGLYWGSSTNSELHIDSSEVYNIRATACGDKGIKTISLGTGNYIHNNVVWGCATNGYTAFEGNVAFDNENGFYDQGNVIDRGIVAGLGGADQVMNVINQNPPNGTSFHHGENKISNMVVVDGRGYTNVYVGGPFDNTSPLFRVHFDSCYFGYSGRFNGADIYTTGQPATNTAWQVNAQPGGGISLIDTINFTHNTFDSTKLTLFSGNAVTLSSGNTLISKVHYPAFANVWAAIGTQFKYWLDIIMGTYGDEFGLQGGKQGQQYAFKSGDTCTYMGLTYISLQNNNYGHVPQARTDAWWNLVTFPNGGLFRPDDVRLVSTDPYAVLNIGLTDKFVSATVTANAGSDQTITLPTNSATLNGTASTGATTYLWTKISGPGATTILNNTTATPTVTGLQAGVYVFQLSINSGASTDQVQVTVNAAPPVTGPAIHLRKRFKLK